jgi:hypothetical protein
MIMFRLYLETLALSVGISTFVVLAVVAMSGVILTAELFIFPILIQVLMTSMVFILRKLLRLHDARITARALAQRTAEQLAVFNNALRNQPAGRAGLSGGFKTWNS